MYKAQTEQQIFFKNSTQHELNLLREILVEESAVCRGSAPASTLLQACITTGVCNWEGDDFSVKGVISTRLVEWDTI